MPQIHRDIATHLNQAQTHLANDQLTHLRSALLCCCALIDRCVGGPTTVDPAVLADDPPAPAAADAPSPTGMAGLPDASATIADLRAFADGQDPPIEIPTTATRKAEIYETILEEMRRRHGG